MTFEALASLIKWETTKQQQTESRFILSSLFDILNVCKQSSLVFVNYFYLPSKDILEFFGGVNYLVYINNIS